MLSSQQIKWLGYACAFVLLLQIPYVTLPHNKEVIAITSIFVVVMSVLLFWIYAQKRFWQQVLFFSGAILFQTYLLLKTSAANDALLLCNQLYLIGLFTSQLVFESYKQPGNSRSVKSGAKLSRAASTIAWIAPALTLFYLTAALTHIWTVVIAFSEGGFLAGIISFFLPVLSELYWMFSMFGENDAYAYTALIHLLLSIPASIIAKG